MLQTVPPPPNAHPITVKLDAESPQQVAKAATMRFGHTTVMVHSSKTFSTIQDRWYADPIQILLAQKSRPAHSTPPHLGAETVMETARTSCNPHGSLPNILPHIRVFRTRDFSAYRRTVGTVRQGGRVQIGRGSVPSNETIVVPVP